MSSDSELFPLVNGPVVSLAAVRLLCDLENRGIDVIAQGDTLAIRPRSALTPGDLDALATLKPHLLAVLAYMDTLPAVPEWLQ